MKDRYACIPICSQAPRASEYTRPIFSGAQAFPRTHRTPGPCCWLHGVRTKFKSDAAASGLFLVSFSLVRLGFLICRMGPIALSQIYLVAQTNNACETIHEPPGKTVQQTPIVICVDRWVCRARVKLNGPRSLLAPERHVWTLSGIPTWTYRVAGTGK